MNTGTAIEVIKLPTEKLGPKATLDELAKEINAEHEASLGSARDAISRAIRVGGLLIRAKDKVAHGEFAEWIKYNCRFGARMAQRYMRAHRTGWALGREMRTRGSHFRGELGEIVGALAGQSTRSGSDGTASDPGGQSDGRGEVQHRCRSRGSRTDGDSRTDGSVSARRTGRDPGARGTDTAGPGADTQGAATATVDGELALGEFVLEKPRISFISQVMVGEEDRIAHLKSIRGDIAEEIVVSPALGEVYLTVALTLEDEVRLNIPKGLAVELAHAILKCAGSE
jgi:hypothetical protein